jgi:hypothetical protein
MDRNALSCQTVCGSQDIALGLVAIRREHYGPATSNLVHELVCHVEPGFQIRSLPRGEIVLRKLLHTGGKMRQGQAFLHLQSATAYGNNTPAATLPYGRGQPSNRATYERAHVFPDLIPVAFRPQYTLGDIQYYSQMRPSAVLLGEQAWVVASEHQQCYSDGEETYGRESDPQRLTKTAPAIP